MTSLAAVRRRAAAQRILAAAIWQARSEVIRAQLRAARSTMPGGAW